MATNFAETDDTRLAIAHEVIVSAGNILAAAGFHRDEIAAFFRQAADMLGGAGVQNIPARPVRDQPTAPAGSVAELQADFAGIAPVRALKNIAVDAQVVAGLRNKSEPAGPYVELALRMFPQIAEAQDWLRNAAREAGFEMASGRRQWSATAPANGSAPVGQTVFFDDFDAGCKASFDFVTALVAAVTRAGDREGLDVLLQGLVSCGVIVDHALKVELERAVHKLIPRDDAPCP